MNWITTIRKFANTCAEHTETLDSCFDLISSHQQHIPWPPPLEIEPATTECRAETLPLSRQIWHQLCAMWTGGSISNRGDHGIRCWWDLLRSKLLSSVFVCHAQVFTGFSSRGYSILRVNLLFENIVVVISFTAVSIGLMKKSDFCCWFFFQRISWFLGRPDMMPYSYRSNCVMEFQVMANYRLTI